ncbi:hypothetical protein T12_13900 [Trichinella patagoniensis]|uniref:Uncharacterized protein n=1 Tax=Trichinella patagoniensis TaxID=990121 RepID=A0A0V0ZRM7_9BILA|nr:hypothetical protein T12_13900 [Trichinella patagoniensis]
MLIPFPEQVNEAEVTSQTSPADVVFKILSKKKILFLSLYLKICQLLSVCDFLIEICKDHISSIYAVRGHQYIPNLSILPEVAETLDYLH